MHKLFYVLIIPLLASCISESTLFHGIDDAQMNCEHMSGNFENDPDENAAPLAWELETMRRHHREPKVYPTADRVSLEYDGASSLNVGVYALDTLMNQFTLKVKKKDNYLEMKPKLRLIPIPILLWIHDEKRVILMNDTAGNLVVSHANFQAIFFLTMARSHNRHGVADYARNR